MSATPRETFETELAAATAPDTAFAALHRLADALVGARLFTVMTIDAEAGLARRAYTSHPEDYPATGTKPIEQNAWYRVVSVEGRPFVANTIEEIAEVFPDHSVIASLGCASVINLPVILAGRFAGTINLLDAAGHFTPERQTIARRDLTLPAMAALALATRPFAEERP